METMARSPFDGQGGVVLIKEQDPPKFRGTPSDTMPFCFLDSTASLTFNDLVLKPIIGIND